jgi:phosphohistidine phosphatase
MCRHAEAVDPGGATGDGERWLTARGRAVQAAVARRLREDHGIRVTRVVTSPLVRAVQSGEILAAAHELSGPREVRRCLTEGPTAAIAALPQELYDPEATLALVGHEPLIRTAAGALTGVTLPGFRTASVCWVAISADGSGHLRGLLDPSQGTLWTPPS